MARRFNLQTVRARVDRLASDAQAECGRGHLRITHEIPGAPLPAFDTAASERCACGAAVAAMRIIHELPESVCVAV